MQATDAPETRRNALSGALYLLAVLVVAAGAFAFRVPRLDQRPMHTDEAIHADKAGTLLETGVYTYDPRDYHGPTIYYFALPFIRAGGARTLADTDEWMFRIVPVVFGTGLVLLLLLAGDGLGRWEAVCAGLLTAISPAMVFYSRYYIQEMTFVFFTFGAIASGWRYVQSRRLPWALACGACLGLMLASKETAILVYAAMAAACGLTWRFSRDDEAVPKARPIVIWHLAAAGILGLIVTVTVVSGFFTHPRGALDIFLTFLSYAHRSSGAGMHDHPWYYYLELLLGLGVSSRPHWHERLILVMVLVGVAAVLLKVPSGNGHFLRFLVFYTLILTAIYALIPYKTPWCMLGFLHGMILLAGVGIAAFAKKLRSIPLRAIFGVVLALAMIQLGRQAYRASYTYCADARNPYVYAHTSTDFLHLAQRVNDIAQVSPEGRNTLIRVITPDAWPLPWYLRGFKSVKYRGAVGDDPDAPIVITSAELQPEVESRLRGTYQTECYGLRPDVLITMFIREDLWTKFIDSRKDTS